MTKPSRLTPRLARSGAWVLAVTVAAAALAIGTVHTVTLCAVSAALALALGLTWWDQEATDFRPRRAATVLLVTGVLLTAYTALQCIPLPAGLLAVLAPRNAEIWARALAPLHRDGPAWAPISLDPTATRIEVLKGVTYLLAFVTALRVARTRDGIAFLSTTIMVTGAALAVAALLHPAFGAHKLYGVWTSAVRDKHVAPFLNPNNLAAYLNVAFCLALAGALSREPRWPRPLLAAAAILLGGTQVWVASRGGVATMLLGGALVAITAGLQRSQSSQRRADVTPLSLILSLVFAVGVLAIVLVSSHESTNELFESDLSKLDLVKQALRMVPAFPVFGVGRGAFASTFPAFRTSPGIWTFSYPENVVAQWVTEWGVPAGTLGLAAVVFGLRPDTMLARSSTASGAWSALVAIAVQNLVDLGTEIPGLMLAPIVCAAIVVGGTAGRSSKLHMDRWGQRPRALVACAGLCALAAIGAASAGIGTELDDDRGALRDVALGPGSSAALRRQRAEAAILRHPAEPYLPLIVGWRAALEHDEDAVRWLEAALERSRVEGPAHLALARIFYRRSPPQARLEYRVAVEQAPELSVLLPEALRLVDGFYDAMELVSDGPTGVTTLGILTRDLRQRLPATTLRLDEELALRQPLDPSLALEQARDEVDDLETIGGAPWCEDAARRACVKRALAAVARAAVLEPSACEPALLRARARIAEVDPPTALAEFTRAADGVSDRVSCLQTLADLAEREHDEIHMTEALTKVAAAGCATDDECTANLSWAAAKEERHGNLPGALAFYKRAYERSPENDEILAASARVAAGAGLHGEADRDYTRLARKHPDEARWKAAAAAEHDALLKGASAL
jgi:hypothetical protein